MSCLIPPALEDSQLLAYLVGNAPAQVHQHLAQCPSCRSRLSELQGWHSWLTTNLYRTPCPSSLELGEYRLRMLNEEQKAKIEQHLTWCPLCQSEVQLFSGDAQALEADRSVNLPQQIVDRVRVIVARLREDLTRMRFDVPKEVLAGMRGQETTKSLAYVADELEISLLIQPDAAQPARRVLLGWVSGYETDQTVEVSLWHGVQQIAATTMDNLGNFAFPALHPGQYDLTLRSDMHEIYINDLDL